MATISQRMIVTVTTCLFFLAMGTSNPASKEPVKHKAFQPTKQGQLLISILSDVEIPNGDAKISQRDYRNRLAAPLAKYLSDKFERSTRSSEVEPTIEQLMKDVNLYNLSIVEVRTESILNTLENREQRSKAIQDFADFIISNLFSNPNNLSNFSAQIEAYKNLSKEDRDFPSARPASSRKQQNVEQNVEADLKEEKKEEASVCQSCSKAGEAANIVTLSCGHTYCTACLTDRFMDRGFFNCPLSLKKTGPVYAVDFRTDVDYNKCPSCKAPFGISVEKELYAELNKTMTKETYKNYLAQKMATYLADEFKKAIGAHQISNFERLFASIWATFADKEFIKVIEDAEHKTHTIRLAQGDKRSAVIQKIAIFLIDALFNNTTLRNKASYTPLFSLYDNLEDKRSEA